MFELDAVKAKHGDCLLLHWGTKTEPHVALIDGGPDGVYRRFLLPRLNALAKQRKTDRVPVELAMVSHIDDDHIVGLIDLAEAIQAGDAPVKIKRFWHNSLEGLLNQKDLVPASVNKATASLASAPKDTKDFWYAKVLATVPNGQTLHRLINQLGLGTTLNHPFSPLVAAGGKKSRDTIKGLKLTVIGPTVTELEELRKKWKALRDESITVAYKDPSPYNLSSIVVMAEYGGKRMLLTGDGRGDLILNGLRTAKLLKNGKIHVDLLKLPHHGSKNNVKREFFEDVTADVYVVSGDNVKFKNPNKDAMTWLAEARAGDDYAIYCTYDLPHMRKLFGKKLVVPKKTAEPWVKAAI